MTQIQTNHYPNCAWSYRKPVLSFPNDLFPIKTPSYLRKQQLSRFQYFEILFMPLLTFDPSIFHGSFSAWVCRSHHCLLHNSNKSRKKNKERGKALNIKFYGWTTQKGMITSSNFKTDIMATYAAQQFNKLRRERRKKLRSSSHISHELLFLFASKAYACLDINNAICHSSI